MISAAVVCLALNIYHEARGESLTGQLAVAQVTLNRTEDPRYPSDVCEVVYEPHQFAWTQDPRPITEPGRLALALWIADLALREAAFDPTDGATHFYSGSAPYWVPAMEVTSQIGGHTFLKEPTP